MLLREVMDAPDADKLLALSQFLISRAQDTNAQKKISVSAFLQLAQSMGISLTQDNLTTLSQRPPLSSVIQTIQGDEILFRGADQEQVTDTMTVDQARATVDTMAKRAAKKGL
jgi:hypothetical protein